MIPPTIVASRNDLNTTLLSWRSADKSIGFVPTMGALHNGHISLIQEATSACDVVVVSIFVNPTQFNKAEDLARYPKTLEADLFLLRGFTNVVIFVPEVSEIYQNNVEPTKIDFDSMCERLEGKFRPGHFDGVAQVVEILFNIVQPSKAFFGQKDYQQVLVVKQLVNALQLSIEIIACPTRREINGLAMSSRNLLLTSEEIKAAEIIWKTLCFVQEKKDKHSIIELQKLAVDFFNEGNLSLEYLEIVNATDLSPVKDWGQDCVCCIAAFCGKVRLIDNLVLN
jgi:pantoate--beta-alanine ligase